MKRMKDAIANYMEKYGAEIAAGYLMMSGHLNAEVLRSLRKRAQAASYENVQITKESC